MEIGATLEIIVILNKGGESSEAKKKIESQNHLDMSFTLVHSMVEEFIARGEEFAKSVR